MRSLLIVLAVVGVAVARPGFLSLDHGARSFLHSPLAYSSVAAPVAYSNVVAPVAHTITSQYHAQDELGQYSYGYSGGQSAKSEVKTFDGVTRGGYSYVDPEGQVQSVNYVADPVNGFRVAATNLPVAPEAIPSEPLVAPVPVEDTPEVAAAKVAHSAAFDEAKAAADAAPDDPVSYESAGEEQAAVNVVRADLLPASVLSRNVGGVLSHPYSPSFSYSAVDPASFSYSAIAHDVAPVSRFAYSSVAPSYSHYPISYNAAVAPATYSYSSVSPASYSYSAVAPAFSHAPISYAYPHTITSQYHAQDGLGQYSYGYSGGPSAKNEVKTFDGVTRGGYSYVDAEGKVQSVNYVSDDINGFRVAATNLPVAPVAPEASVLEGVPDSVEVAAAKAQHFAAHEEAKARLVA